MWAFPPWPILFSNKITREFSLYEISLTSFLIMTVKTFYGAEIIPSEGSFIFCLVLNAYNKHSLQM